MRTALALIMVFAIVLSSCTSTSPAPKEDNSAVIYPVNGMIDDSGKTRAKADNSKITSEDSSSGNLPPVPVSPSEDKTPNPTTADLEKACLARTGMEFNAERQKCGCKKGLINDLKRSGCLTPDGFQAQCERVDGAVFDSLTNRCGCKETALVPSAFTNTCVSRIGFLDQVCNDRAAGGKYNPEKNRCECPPKTTPSADFTTCVPD